MQCVSHNKNNSNMNENQLLLRKLFVCLFIVFGTLSVIYIFKGKHSRPTVLNRNFGVNGRWNQCRHISLDELDQWFHSKVWNEIPKIIHQTWKNNELRERQVRWSNTWCHQYTDWRYHLWTDDENDKFVRTKFPWFYSTYKQLSPAILQVDSVRYLYMLYYGGLYLDLDYESIRRVDEHFPNKGIVLSLINYQFDSMNSVPNSWMASKPNHPLWTYVLYRIMLLWSRASEKEHKEFWNGKAEFFTGPQSLFEGLTYYLNSIQRLNNTFSQFFQTNENRKSDSIFTIADITFLGPKLINAYDWMTGIGIEYCSAEKATFNEEACKNIVKPIYAITYWSHTYGHGHENDANYLRKTDKIV